MKDNWKFFAAIVVVLVVLGFCARRLYRSFSDRVPPGVRLTQRTGPSIPKQTWSKFKLLLKATQEEADYNVLPIGSIHFIELTDDPNEAIYWLTDRCENRAGSPLGNFERTFNVADRELLGYYTLAGDAIPFTVKEDPARPGPLILTINLDEPIAPGKSELIIRRESRAPILKSFANGSVQLSLGLLPGANREIHARGVQLSPGATLARYAPEKGALTATEGVTMVGWINSRIGDQAAPLTVRFTMPK
jgi:hypothetical protein